MWTTVLQLSELPIGERKILNVNNVPIALFNLNGDIVCIEDVCPHQYLPLADDGEVSEAGEITCPFHGAKFCLRTGEVTAPPAFSNLTTYPVKIEQDNILIDI